MSSLLDVFPQDLRQATVRHQLRRANLLWAFWFLGILAATLLTGLCVLYVTPLPLPVGALLFGASLVAVVARPRYGLYLILFFSLLGDSVMMPWYPFVKNLSSPESLLYIHSAVIVSPMECYLLLTILVWLGKGAMQRKLDFYRGDLFWPLVIFGAFMALGLVYGLLTGGNLNIALWEVRPILTFPLVAVLAGNLLEKPAHVIHLMWWIAAALFIEGLIGTFTFAVFLGGSLANVEAITEHSAAIHMNTLFVLGIAVYLYRGSITHRIWVPLMIPPVLLAYLATQRRAAYLSLGIAIVFIFAIMYQRQRKLFWAIVPAALILISAYLGVFWNAQGALAQPANAVKSMIAPDMDGADYSSNLYRLIENTNVAHTIHRAPLTGVGFGNKFHILVPMPDISFFVWWEYIIHNSILWIWIQTGVAGFISLLFLIGLSIITGIRAFMRLADGPLRVVTLVATLYIVMHFMFAYVDMSWDTQSMLYLGAMVGVINRVEHIAGLHAKTLKMRWPWQAHIAPSI